jgi:NAD(P)-dependent dehydrogenase (short-subunit alcohol dehydrogenase family)
MVPDPPASTAPRARGDKNSRSQLTIRDIHAVGRWAEPHEIANAILFLAAEENAFITGTILTVDGGLPLAKRCRLRNVTMEVQYYPTPITKSPVAAVT